VWTESCQLAKVADAYGIAPFWDYERAGGGLLLANGTGVMLSAMDAIPELGYCADLTGLRAGPDLDRWLQFILWADRLCPLIAATLICYIDDPDPLQQILAKVHAARLAAYGNRLLHPSQQRARWREFVALARGDTMGIGY
jgi:hypothetical protein